MLSRSLLLSLILICAAFQAPAIDTKTVPDLLKPWIPWVLVDQPQAGCPFFYQNFQQKKCSWSGPLQLDLEAKQGHFTGEWTLYEADWVVLPGDQRLWPQQVMNGQNPLIVLERQAKPAIWLAAGHYRISGMFYWDKLPESLAISNDTGLIQLSINGNRISYPRIDQGSIWLNPKQALKTDNQQDSLDVQVFRQIIDDNPMQMITRLILQVSGTAREVSLPYALLPSAIPVRLDSPLPARIETDGKLLLQVRPGQWSISIHARYPQLLSQLDLAIADPEWPNTELWAFQAMPALRLVEIDNLAAIDSSQTNLPPEWRHLPAYPIRQGQSMHFNVIRRGDPTPEPNQLRLQRKLWLDFNGDGYTVSDQIEGKMTRDWRLNAVDEIQLGQVLLNGQNQLITRLGESQQGVEVRRGSLNLQADSRIVGPIGTLNAVGWQESFQQVQAELNIPPGWRLLAVSGVDNDPNSWLSRWSLLDLFLVLIIALSISRLWSWHWGILALFSLMLFWHENEAPQWIWLNTLAALALLRVMPQNRFSRWVNGYRNLCWLGLALIVIPFMVNQLRIAIYPQLEIPWQPIERPLYADSAVYSEEFEAGAALQAPAAPLRSKAANAYASRADSASSAQNFARIDPEANLQTGPGLPQWQWQSVQLSWNGAVDNQQQIRLWYLSPAWTFLLHILQALLVALLSLKMLGLLNKSWRLPQSGLTVWLLLPVLLLAHPDGFADIPDQTLLEQLKTRLLKSPECLPNCARAPTMQIDIKPESMRIELEIHAQETVAVPLPAQWQQWFPEQIKVDGSDAQALIRQNDGSLWMGLSPGVHNIVLQGRLAEHYKFNLPLVIQPQRCRVNSEGWRVDGVYENGKVGAQLEFSRLNNETNPLTQTLHQAALPAFVRIERTLHLGLDWRVTTRVEQLIDNDAPIVLELPILPGEAVTSAQIRIKEGKALVNLPVGQRSLEWDSLLEKREKLELKADESTQWSEVWRADIGPIWHLHTEGIAVIHHQDQQGSWLPEWRPWPGETVTLHISRPQPVAGPTLTIDKTQLNIQPGKRNQLVNLNLQLRSSKGGQHNLRLPEQAVLQSVSIDNVPQPIRQKAELVTLPIRPGAQQVSLTWQTTREQASILTTPLVNLGIESVNSHIQLTSGADRWVLLTLGPKFGPAALIWGLLPVLLLLAMGLGKIPLTPLKTWHWFLLLIGLSQIHIGAGFLVILWLFGLGMRGRQSPEKLKYFNGMQIGLSLLTLAALLLLFGAVQQGLLGTPDMQITGNQSTAWQLNWYQDHSDPVLPTATVISVPMQLYRLLMLAWSLWMALSLLNWLRWGWDCFVAGGIWKKAPPAPKPVKAEK